MEQDIDLIEKYLAAELSSQEIEFVKNRMASDPVFASRVKIIEDSRKAVSLEVDDFRSDLQEVYDSYQKTTLPSAKPFFRSGYGIAAALTALAIAFAGYLILFQGPSLDTLYADNFSVPPENISMRNESSQDLLNAALQAYNNDDFTGALRDFEKILSDHPEHQGVLFYSGICQLVTDQNQQALDTFNKLLSTPSGEYHTAAMWYLSLTYLKTGDEQNAKKTLAGLSRMTNGKYSRDAGVLLEKLN